MATNDRMRKAWLRWLLELKHNKDPEYEFVKANAEKYPHSMRLAFEAGYRAKRRDNEGKEQKPKL